MSFLPPIRWLLPALLLVFGLTMSWLDYELNLANDMERNLAEVGAQADATGRRLAEVCTHALAKNDLAAVKDAVSAWKGEPWLRIAVIADDEGKVMADSAQQWEGRTVAETPAAQAWKLTRSSGGGKASETSLGKDNLVVTAAFKIPVANNSPAWVLVVFDRADAAGEARHDARRQLAWLGAATGLLCLLLWAALHFGLAARLAWLAGQAKQIGAGEPRVIEPLPGADEIHELSVAFATMSRQLIERERERAALEREIIESAEQERRRIGHELHDGIGQHLTATLMTLNALAEEVQRGSPELTTRTESLVAQLRSTITEVRALSHGLAPVPMWESGLEHALLSLAETTSKGTGVRCVLECPDPVTVDNPEVAGNLYRIAQEAVNNALKHAKAEEIRIGLEQRGGQLLLEIEDDGEGLPEAKIKQGGIGLRVMRHRAEVMGGMFTIGAAPAGGTRVAVQLPLPAAARTPRR